MKNTLVLLLTLYISVATGCGQQANPTNTDNTNNHELSVEEKQKIDESAKKFTQDPEVHKALGILADYERTPEAVAKNIQEADTAITYAHLKKNADKYLGKPWMCTGRILQIFEKGGETTARIGIGAYGSDPIWIYGKFATDFIEKDRLAVIGYLNGDYSYVSQAGWNITIPSMVARAMLKPGEVTKLKEQARRDEPHSEALPTQKRPAKESDLQRRRREANRLLNR